MTPTQPALSPPLSMVNGAVQINTNVIGSSSIWGSRAVSGVSTISASRAVSGVSTIYSSSVWGDKSVSTASSPSVDLSSIALKGE